MKNFYSKEQVERVCELYNDGVRVSDIAKVVGVEQSSVSKIAKRKGLELRHPKVKTSKFKKCYHCKQDLPSAFRFCPYCGKDVRSEQDIIVESLNSLYDLFSLLPANSRDEARDIVNKVKVYICKGSGVEK